MKTQNNKLNFTTNTIVELDKKEISEINGGSSWACVSLAVIAVAVTVADHAVISVVRH